MGFSFVNHQFLFWGTHHLHGTPPPHGEKNDEQKIRSLKTMKTWDVSHEIVGSWDWGLNLIPHVSWCWKSYLYVGVSSSPWGYPKISLDGVMENPIVRNGWFGATPHLWKPPYFGPCMGVNVGKDSSTMEHEWEWQYHCKNTYKMIRVL